MTLAQITDRAIKKAQQSISKYKVSAVAFDKKGDILGIDNNQPKVNAPLGGDHAEQRLMRRYGNNIKTILIYRTNTSGTLLPIHPCNKCSKIAEKLGIVIRSIY